MTEVQSSCSSCEVLGGPSWKCPSRVRVEKAGSKQTWNSARWNSPPHIMHSVTRFTRDGIQVITCDTLKVHKFSVSVCGCVIWSFLIFPTVQMNSTRFLKHNLMDYKHPFNSDILTPVRSYKAIQSASKTRNVSSDNICLSIWRSPHSTHITPCLHRLTQAGVCFLSHLFHC